MSDKDLNPLNVAEDSSDAKNSVVPEAGEPDISFKPKKASDSEKGNELIYSNRTDENKDDEKTSENKTDIDFNTSRTDKTEADEVENKDTLENSEKPEPVKEAETKPAPVKTEEKAVKKKPAEKKKKKKKKKKRSRFNGSIFGGIIIVVLILTVSMVLAVGGISVGIEYYGIGKSDNDISFNIPKGSTNEQIATQLAANGIIKNEKLFLMAIKLYKPETIYPGDITLQPSMGYAAIIETLETQRESYETVTITFTEGENLLEIAQKLEDNGVCDASDFLFEFNKSQDFDFEEKITDNENTYYAREGYFFPDTYEFYVGDTAYNVTKIVRENFEKKITEKMYTRMDKLNLTLNETITLASMVQLEARNADEMPTVASVFLNRLNDSDTFPQLQSDPTGNYVTEVIATQSDNQSTIDHYSEYYDTYQCNGLPAGPICNPGLDAINAVLYPDDTDYYYFCNDLDTGESFYAETLEEHEKNLKKAGLS